MQEYYAFMYHMRLRSLIGDMSQKEFAAFTGISETMLSECLTKGRTPRIYTLCRICEECDVSLDWLFGVREKGAQKAFEMLKDGKFAEEENE